MVRFITSGQSNLATGRIAAAHGRYSLYLTVGRPSLSKLPLTVGDLDPHLIQWFLEPTPVHIPKAMSIGSAAFAGLTVVTVRQTDRPRYIGNDGPHLCT